MMVQSKPKQVGTIVIYFNVKFNVLKQNDCALVGVIKDWISQNARYKCGKKRASNVCPMYAQCMPSVCPMYAQCTYFGPIHAVLQ